MGLQQQILSTSGQQGVSASGMGVSYTGGFPIQAGWQDRVKDYITKVREVAHKHGCAGFSITVGIPWGISASFDFGVSN